MNKAPRILIVDDNQDDLMLLRLTLEDQGYIVSQASGPDSALIQMKNRNFDIVILDLLMPEMDGISLCKKIKKDFPNSNSEVVFLTALDSDFESMTQAFGAGAELYLFKPYDEQEITSRIGNLLRRKTQAMLKSA